MTQYERMVQSAAHAASCGKYQSGIGNISTKMSASTGIPFDIIN